MASTETRATKSKNFRPGRPAVPNTPEIDTAAERIEAAASLLWTLGDSEGDIVVREIQLLLTGVMGLLSDARERLKNTSQTLASETINCLDAVQRLLSYLGNLDQTYEREDDLKQPLWGLTYILDMLANSLRKRALMGSSGE